MASEAAPAAAGGEDWKAQLQLPPKDSRIRTAVSFALSLAEGGEEEERASVVSLSRVARARSRRRGRTDT